MGLGEGADSLLLQNIAVATKGAHFPVSRAEDLMTAFLTIMGQVHNFMFFEGAPEPVQLLAGTTRVAYVVIKRSPDATITSVMRNGLAVDPKASFFSKYPEFVDPKKFNFKLKPDSPAFGLGFKQIDVSKVGPREKVGPEK